MLASLFVWNDRSPPSPLPHPSLVPPPTPPHPHPPTQELFRFKIHAFLPWERQLSLSQVTRPGTFKDKIQHLDISTWVMKALHANMSVYVCVWTKSIHFAVDCFVSRVELVLRWKSDHRLLGDPIRQRLWYCVLSISLVIGLKAPCRVACQIIWGPC